MRDLVVFGIFFCALPFVFTRPYVGILLASWFGYMNPHRLTFGPAHDFPFVVITIGVTLLGILIITLKGEKLRIPWCIETYLLIIFILAITATSFFAIFPDEAWTEWQRVIKVQIIIFLTILLINDEKYFKYLALLIALSIGFFGLKGGIFTVATGGGSMIFGPGGSIEDNTALGLALNMVLPILYFMAKDEKNIWLKRLLYGVFVFSIISVIFTYSRGAFVGLVVVLGCIFLSFKFKYKFLIAILFVLSIPVILGSIPDKWYDRISTIKTYEEDGSANARFNAWIAAWNLAKDSPFTGGGFQIIDNVEIIMLYNPEATHKDVGVHSIYFEVLGETGFIAFGLFIALLVSSILTTRKIKRLSKEKELWSFFYYAYMLEIGIYAYAVTGTFLEFAYFDLYYHLIAMVIILKAIFNKEINALETKNNIDQHHTPEQGYDRKSIKQN